jgi:hypothetical protein
VFGFLGLWFVYVCNEIFNSCSKPEKLDDIELPIAIDSSATYVTPQQNLINTEQNKWQYDSSIDKMTSKTSKFATITSNESLDLDFPYDGVNFGYLIIRKMNDRLGILIRVDKGQISGGYENNYIKVRFDDETPITFSYSEPADNSSDLIFIENKTKFLSKLKKSKKTLIEIPFYQNGNQILEFNTQNLEW